ncbi:cytochrome c oxidase accessory protein CcoG [Neptuniibacter caesariensis]|uniref:Probable iron-sulfur protein n=1 Tax=Neptuniibacter caesariensis TaxID=207954 RepID=A0A7U8GTL7_NEPCE|nr:cytochrome c oxidase accessory protein CcoG [Neptuniibacter caesariensis]EAR62422.1 probable iron-sulfur protein [Oceanospirillum sp. MED92] [Neptuniibacter caesariensis]
MQQSTKSEIPLTNIHEAPPLPGNGKFHVRLVEGFYQNLRRFISWPLIGLFFAMVWFKIGDRPAVLFDFESHRIFLFTLELSWYDLPILAGLLIAGASLLFFMAVGWGRVWCGFACPQSIWTWLFIRLEDLTEGKAAFRAKNENRPLTGIRLLRRVLKHLSWGLLSLATAITFSAYFVPVEKLLSDLINIEASLFTLSWITTMALLTYLNAGLVREKVCLHMCPYSRFQGVMFDPDTRTVTYDAVRGEPRRGLKDGSSTGGDCVDCGICVQVCPTGIDIRDGLQAACIDCAACIDACDTVMKKIGKPTGLIEFYSEKELAPQGRTNNQSVESQSSILRGRLLGYLSVLVITVWGVAYGLSNSKSLLVEVARERGQLYQQVEDSICNSYQIELQAFDKNLRQVEIGIKGMNENIHYRLIGPAQINLIGKSTQAIYRVCAPVNELNSRNEIAFTFSKGKFNATKKSTFIAPS